MASLVADYAGILKLQNAKRALAHAALSGEAVGNLAKLTMADMLRASSPIDRVILPLGECELTTYRPVSIARCARRRRRR